MIVTKVGEVVKYLADGRNAFLCDPNEASIAAKIFEIIRDYQHALEVGISGRICVE